MTLKPSTMLHSVLEGPSVMNPAGACTLGHTSLTDGRPGPAWVHPGARSRQISLK